MYFDSQKAFDRVDHNNLLHKLRLIGFEICFVQLISSHLTDRYQSVRINDSISPSVHIPSGVPQLVWPVAWPVAVSHLYK